MQSLPRLLALSVFLIAAPQHILAETTLFPSVEFPDQGKEAGEFGHLTLKDLPSHHNWQLTLSDNQGNVLWQRDIPAAERSPSSPSINHLIPFVIPDTGEYEIRLSREGKWVVRLHLLSENSRLWVGESLHEAVLNMLGIMRTINWSGSPTTNLPSDDPKFVAWVTSREQSLIQQISSALKP
jgi:hypothetical protein